MAICVDLFNSCSITHIKRNKIFIIRPIRLIKQRTSSNITPFPVNPPEPLERWRTKLERTTIQHNNTTGNIDTPISSPKGTTLIPMQEVTVMGYLTEPQLTTIGNYKFLIHNTLLILGNNITFDINFILTFSVLCHTERSEISQICEQRDFFGRQVLNSTSHTRFGITNHIDSTSILLS